MKRTTYLVHSILLALLILSPQPTNAFSNAQETFLCHYFSFILHPIGRCTSDVESETSASGSANIAVPSPSLPPETNTPPTTHTTSTIFTTETIYLPGEQWSHTLTAEELQPFLENFAFLNQQNLVAEGVTQDQLANVLRIARGNNSNTSDRITRTSSNITELGTLNNTTLTGDIGLSDLTTNALLYPNASGVLTAAVGLSLIDNSLIIGTSTAYEKLTVDGPIYIGSEVPTTTASR